MKRRKEKQVKKLLWWHLMGPLWRKRAAKFVERNLRLAGVHYHGGPAIEGES